MKRSSLKILNLTTASDRKEYKRYSTLINAKNPFFRLELLITPETNLEGLKCFVFAIDEVPKILMLFCLRNIKINEKPSDYVDVISPYGYCGPIFNKCIEQNSIFDFWEAVDNWYRKNNVVSEFIRFSLNNNHICYSGSIVPTLDTVNGLILPADEQWQNYRKKVRNNIRKATEHGLKFEIFQNEGIRRQYILEFHEIYIASMKRNNAEKRYFYSLQYFENLIQNNSDCCALAMVQKDGKTISVELLLLSNSNIYSFLGGTDSKYFMTRPNDFLKHHVINWGRSQGFTHYILGGGQINNDSLYSYKKSFFPYDKDVTFYTGRKILNNALYNKLVLESSSFKETETKALDIFEGFFPKYRFGN